MFGRKRRKMGEKVGNERELISHNERAIESLIVLAKDDEELIQELKRVQEKIKYLTPSDNGKVADYDKKIKNLIEDMRIVLIKADKKSDEETLPAKAMSILQQIKLAIADRNAKL